jgi:hypothetical protein
MKFIESYTGFLFEGKSDKVNNKSWDDLVKKVNTGEVPDLYMKLLKIKK